MTDLPTEIVWCNAMAGIDYFLALPRPDFDDAMELLKAWKCSSWGELRETASDEHYDYICSSFGFNSSDPPRTEEPVNPDDWYDAPPSDDEPIDIDSLEDGSALAGWILNVMAQTLPLEVFALEGEFGSSTLDGFMLEILAERTLEVLQDLVDAGITVTRDDRLADMYTDDSVGDVIDPPEGWDQIQVST